MPARDNSDCHQIIVISDTHCGCRLGLYPDEPVVVDDGGPYEQGPTQKFIWHHWQKFWKEWVPSVTKREPYHVVHNGDATDGVPHRATTPVSHNLDDQQKIAEACLRPVVQKCRGKYYQIRGTEAHVGKSSVEEERLARSLGAVPNKVGQYSRYELRKRVGPCLIHFAHHIGVTGSSQHEASAVNAELYKMYVEASRWGDEPPDMIVRSHRHSHIEVRVPIFRKGRGSAPGRHRASCIVTPAWQGKTPFAYRVARGKPPQFGGILIRWNGEVLYSESYVETFNPTEIE